MKNERPTSDNHHYKVAVEPLYTRGHRETCYCGTIRQDTGGILGICKPKYGIIQNEDLTTMVERVFKANGMGKFERLITVCREGARMFAQYDFHNKIVKVPHVGDKLYYRLVANNSFDGSCPLSLQFEAVRLGIGDVLTTTDSEFYLSKKHTMNISIESIKKALDASLHKYSDVAKVFGDMADIEIKPKQGLSIIGGLVKEHILTKRNALVVGDIWHKEQDRNLWSLYNSITEWTHKFETKHFENAQKLNARIGTEFVQMAKDQHRIKELVEEGKSLAS